MSGEGRSTGTPRRLGGASARSTRRELTGESSTGTRNRDSEDQTKARPANRARSRVGGARGSRDGTANDELSSRRSSIATGSARPERDTTGANRVADSAATLDDIDPSDLAALHDRREFFLRSLADLEREHDAGDLADDDYTTLRDDYTARAAEILRAIDEHRIVDDESPTIRRPLRLLAIVAVVVLAGVGAGWFVARSSGTRQAGQTITGGLRNGAQSGSGKQSGGAGAMSGSGGATSATISPALQRCIDQTVTVGRPLLQGQAALDAAGVRKATAAGACYRSVLKTHPKDAGALTYRAWNTALLLRGSPGLPTDLQQQLGDATRRDLAAAEAADPKLPDAYAFGAISALWQSRCADARAQLARLDALHLPSTNQIVQLVSTLRPQVTPKACGS